MCILPPRSPFFHLKLKSNHSFIFGAEFLYMLLFVFSVLYLHILLLLTIHCHSDLNGNLYQAASNSLLKVKLLFF
jgi:hypothetical protein